MFKESVMNVSLWVAAVLVAVIVTGAGAEKLATPIGQYRHRRHWAEGVDRGQIRLLGTLEVLGAAGLVIPAITGIAPGLVAVAAACVAVLLLGAIVVEVREGAGAAKLLLPLVTLGLALAVAIGRATIAPF
jgi:DoxX-like family